MKKIMFNDRFGLTDAVLNRRKTQTRRIVSSRKTFKGEWVAGFHVYRRQSDGAILEYPCMYDADERDLDGGQILPKYKVGEIIAIAQDYSTILNELEDPKNYCCMGHWETDGPKRAHYAGLCYHPGGTNKMFVAPNEMPHQIKIAGIRIERLQEISDEDCIKEGVYMDEDPMNVQAFIYSFPNALQWYFSPQEAYAHMIERICGKGTWTSNPYVFVYDFELVK